LAAALSLAACGGGSTAGDTTRSQARKAAATSPKASGTTPKSRAGNHKKAASKPYPIHRARAADVAVITAWADTLRAGHVRKAASYFNVPVIVQNAGPAVRLTTRRQVLDFNVTLPCGAHVFRVIAGQRYTVATFVLTERPGSPGCGATGQLAATAFLLKHGKISEWRRVLVPPLGTNEAAPSGPEA
jgi:hypothetical protein